VKQKPSFPLQDPFLLSNEGEISLLPNQSQQCAEIPPFFLSSPVRNERDPSFPPLTSAKRIEQRTFSLFNVALFLPSQLELTKGSAILFFLFFLLAPACASAVVPLLGSYPPPPVQIGVMCLSLSSHSPSFTLFVRPKLTATVFDGGAPTSFQSIPPAPLFLSSIRIGDHGISLFLLLKDAVKVCRRPLLLQNYFSFAVTKVL